MSTEKIPHAKGLDNTLEVLLKEGYKYILNKREELDTNVFDTRLLGEKTICLSGEEAAKLFYNNDKFKRDGAMLNRVLNTLFGQGGVQTLDGEAHKHRKKMFLPMLESDALKEIDEIAERQWEEAILKWEKEEQIVLYEEVQEILTRTMVEWVGVPVREDDYRSLAQDLTKMFEAAAKIGFEYRAGKKAREEREKWMINIVKSVRNKEVEIPKEKLLYQFVWHKDLDGEFLPEAVVAVEVLNLLRPMVAVAVYVNFVALALHDFPEQEGKVKEGGEMYRELYAEEVRRFYPFFPFGGARVKKDFTWKGYAFKEGTLTLLDLYGTNHDKTIWDQPNEFNPERFKDRKESDFDLIPQGGGKAETGHRCPGELMTIEMMKVALDVFVNKMSYHLPEQDFTYNLTEMPSMPKDKIIMSHIKRK